MIRDDIIRACDSLTLWEMEELRNILIHRIQCARSLKSEGKSPLRCSMLLGEMAKIQGKKAIDYFSRVESDVWARTMVAYQMLMEGYSTIEVGHQMLKDHSSIIYLKKKMQGVFDLPHAYRDILNIWDTFQKHIQQ